MSHRDEIRDFLTSRRAKISPEDAGLPAYGTTRRVPGLRREEVAVLAGISAEYYTRLERGYTSGVSESVLGAVARALQLDEAERAHLLDLIRVARPSRAPRITSSQERVRPTVQRVIDSMSTPAYVRNGRLDLLATNRIVHALYSVIFADPVRPANAARFIFLNPKAPDLFVEWDKVAHDCVAVLRAEAGREPHDRRFTELIGELSTRSEDFRVRWAAHDVMFSRMGVQHLHHGLVGDLTLNYEAFDLAGDRGLKMLAFTAEPGSRSDESLALLASWEGAGTRSRAHDR